MKQQLKAFTPAQESRFSALKDRKALIEKDVNRTDRTHAFFEGEKNPNLTVLADILSTYLMYNFDLGYVQGEIGRSSYLREYGSDILLLNSPSILTLTTTASKMGIWLAL